MKTLACLATSAAALALAGCHVVVHDRAGAWSDDEPVVDDSGPGHPCANDGQCRTGCYCDSQARACHDSRACSRELMGTATNPACQIPNKASR